MPPLPAGARVPSAPPVVPFGAHEAPEREAIAAGDSTGNMLRKPCVDFKLSLHILEFLFFSRS